MEWKLLCYMKGSQRRARFWALGFGPKCRGKSTGGSYNAMIAMIFYNSCTLELAEGVLAHIASTSHVA